MVNEFLPFINEDLVEAMQKDIPSTPVGSARNRRSLPAWSASPEMDTERCDFTLVKCILHDSFRESVVCVGAVHHIVWNLNGFCRPVVGRRGGS